MLGALDEELLENTFGGLVNVVRENNDILMGSQNTKGKVFGELWRGPNRPIVQCRPEALG